MNELIILVIGILATGAGIYELLRIYKFSKVGQKSKGQITGLKTVLDNDNNNIDLPTIEFQTIEGKQFKTLGDTNLLNKEKQVDIIYDPKNPRSSIINHWTKHLPWAFLIATGILALIFYAASF